MPTRDSNRDAITSKVPQVTLAFWIIKILATTLGETGGDAVTMSWLGETTAEAKGTGYLIGTAIFGVIFIIAVLVQIKAKKFHPFLYWLTIVATTTVGTTLADYCTRSIGIGYTGGSPRPWGRRLAIGWPTQMKWAISALPPFSADYFC